MRNGDTRLATEAVPGPDGFDSVEADLVFMIRGDFGRLSQVQRAIVLAEPCWRMRWFASLLNWNGLELEWIRFSDEDALRYAGVPDSRILVYYATKDQKFNIQINGLPDHPRLYQASVGPFRYGICQVKIGWHRFELFDDDGELQVEARRLTPFLNRRQFRDPVRRAAWKKAHAESLLQSRKK